MPSDESNAHYLTRKKWDGTEADPPIEIVLELEPIFRH